MKIIRDLSSLQSHYPYPVLTIGAFDGIHLGHQEIIRQVRERAREKRGTAALFTFSDHPERALDASPGLYLITPPDIKEEILREMGLDLLIWVPFTREFAQKEPRDFVEQDLVGRLEAKEIWVGFDFAFGRGRAGNAHTLLELGKAMGFHVEVIPPVVFRGRTVSSTAIRALLRKGEVAEASLLLGRPYTLRGEVVRGRGRGRDLGFPTANLKPPPDFPLPAGVYAGAARVEGKIYPAAISVGGALTFADEDWRVEVHFVHFRGDLYDRKLEVQFWERIREQRRFASEQELVRSIREDTERAEGFFSTQSWQRRSDAFTSGGFCGKKPGDIP